jgi:hypothetical protein
MFLGVNKTILYNLQWNECLVARWAHAASEDFLHYISTNLLSFFKDNRKSACDISIEQCLSRYSTLLTDSSAFLKLIQGNKDV